ncbi:hypothetical protein AMTRI_Chr04g249900 [Amborella trichopoda]
MFLGSIINKTIFILFTTATFGPLFQAITGDLPTTTCGPQCPTTTMAFYSRPGWSESKKVECESQWCYKARARDGRLCPGLTLLFFYFCFIFSSFGCGQAWSP